MNKPKVFEKPIGFKDLLPDAVERIQRVERQALKTMKAWGYEQIMTPTIEYYDTVGTASSTSDEKLFKLLSNRGQTLVLRSDMTAPIARVVASVLKDTQLPIRLSYHANVFRAIEADGGREAEFVQTGAELVGDATAEADAEIVALAIACLQAAGVHTFKIAIGHVGFLNGLFEETLPNQQETQRDLKQCLLARDYVGYRERLKQVQLDSSVRQELEGILRLRGGREVSAQAKQLTKQPEALQAIQHLVAMWDIFEAYGVSDYIVLDLTMIGDFSYYTGMTFEGYAQSLGFPVVSGGRYDNLLQQFERPAAATGFALKTTRIVELLLSEDEGAQQRNNRTYIIYRTSTREQAFTRAAQLRSESKQVITINQDTAADQVEKLEASGITTIEKWV